MWLWLFTILVVVMIITHLPKQEGVMIAPQSAGGKENRLAQIAWQKTATEQVVDISHGYLILQIGELPVPNVNGQMIFAKIQLAYLSRQSAKVNTRGFEVISKQQFADDEPITDVSQAVASIIASVWQQQSTYCAVVNLNGNNQQIINPQKDVSDILQTATKHHPHNGKAIFQPRIFYSFSHNLPLIMP